MMQNNNAERTIAQRLSKYRHKEERAELYALFSGLVQVVTTICLFYIPARLMRKKIAKPIWLFGERGTDAKDNALFLFEYVRENHPEIEAFYLISEKSKDSVDYKRLKKSGHIVHSGSAEHKKVLLASDVLVCTHLIGGMLPWSMRLHYQLRFIGAIQKKFAFLQHGVIYNDLSEKLHRSVNPVDLFIAGAKPEYDYLLKTLGYTEKVLKYTGLARYDLLHDIKVKNQIVVMPTWRRYLANTDILSPSEFKKTDYFLYYQNFLNDKRVLENLERWDMKMVFYLHSQMQDYVENFSTTSHNIIIARKEDYDVSTLLKESKVLITDYSSIFMDFAYMKKPALYYHFDQNDFFSDHTTEGYFTHRRDGFGPVCTSVEELLAQLAIIADNEFKIEEKYHTRAEKFFPLHDRNNRKRHVQEIKKIIDNIE